MAINPKMRLVVVAALVGLLLPFGAANSQNAGRSIWLEGAHDCGRWLDARKGSLSTVEGAYLLAHVEAYVVGYLDGLAAGKQIDFWRGPNRILSRSQVYYWLDRYCRDKPMKTTTEGMHELFETRDQ